MAVHDRDKDKYADLLLALGEASGGLRTLERELTGLIDWYEDQSALRRFLGDPAVRLAGKRDALEEILGQEVSSELLYFLLLLQEHDAIRHLGEIAQAFRRKVSARREQANGDIVSPAPLPDEKVAAIEKEVGRILERDVHLRVRVAPHVVAGLLVQVGDFILDGTLDRDLDQVRRSLLS